MITAAETNALIWAGALTPPEGDIEDMETKKKTSKPHPNNSLNLVSSHPLYHSMLLASDLFEKNVLECDGERLNRRPRHRLHLLNDFLVVAVDQHGYHLSLLPHILYAAGPACWQFDRIFYDHTQTPIPRLNIIQGTGHDHPALVNDADMIGDHLNLGKLM